MRFSTIEELRHEAGHEHVMPWTNPPALARTKR